ncbi:MAG: hypothetical protein H5T72_10710 [Actinobacteria bacterium]|nr:hypothetical protein [Actinomycetota bacterium]
MNEVFHEDILETFLFFFLASLGIIQAMAARRGWHGLSLYGGRVRENVNRALGAGLVIFAYAWYFSDPLHRNVRNIEALMSMVCLVLGILAAAAFSLLAASLSEYLRRLRRGAGVGKPEGKGERDRRVSLTGGTAILHGVPGAAGAGRRLVMVGEPGGLNRRLLGILARSLPPGTEALSLWTSEFPTLEGEDPREAFRRPLCSMLEEMETRGVFSPQGSVFLGLGWGADQLLLARRFLEGRFRPDSLVALAPVLPGPESPTLGDALLSNTPSDILGAVRAMKPWRESRFRSLLRAWIPTCALCVLAATALTASLQLRWWFLSGPLGGAVASLWLVYYLDRTGRKKGVSPRKSWEEKAASALSSLELRDGECPLTVVLPGDIEGGLSQDIASRSGYPGFNMVTWPDALRGKFLLEGRNAERLAGLLFPAGGSQAGRDHGSGHDEVSRG